MERIVFHIDVNNAYLSWTAIKLLKDGHSIDIRTIEAIIGGDEEARHGIVLAKSMPAKKKGIATAETIYSARKKCPKLEIFPPDFDLYHDMSMKMYNYLKNYSPNIEYYSIDECFIDMTKTSLLYKDLMATAYKIKEDIKNNFGFTVNVGIGNNKLLAKMASDFEKPDKVHTLFINEIETKMWPLPVGELFMVGRKSAKLLNELGIFTIGELAQADIKMLNKHFKSMATSMWQSANGIDNSLVEKHIAKDKSISISFTTSKDIDDIDELKKILLAQSQEIGMTMRSENKAANVIAITIRTYDFINYSKQMKLNNAIFSSKEIYEYASKLLETAWNREKVRNIGIRLSGLTEDNSHQLSIFESIDNKEKDDKVQEAIDKINSKFKSQLVKPASLYRKKNNENK